MSVPAQPEPDGHEAVRTVDGLNLHSEWFDPRGPLRGSLVIVHGFSSHVAPYRHVAAALAGAGFATTTFDVRGHGASQGRAGFVARFARFHEDLATVCEHARQRAPGRPWGVVGHSHGATITLSWIIDAGARPDAVVLAAPWLALRMKVPAWKVGLARIMGTLWPTLTMDNGLDPAASAREPDVVARIVADPQVHHAATPRWFNEVRASQRRILAGAGRLEVPTLMLVAGSDKVVDTDAALAFAEAANASHPGVVNLRRYEPTYHEMFLEPERDAITEDIVSWLKHRWPL